MAKARKTQRRLDERLAGFERHHANRKDASAFTRPGSRNGRKTS